MKEIIYCITCRDANGKAYLKSDGHKVGEIKIEREFLNVHIVEKDCGEYFKDFQALTGSDNINIDVRTHNKFLGVYQLLYSYYGREKRFIKH